MRPSRWTGGLATAMLLARAKADVIVLEKQSFVGGRTSLIESDGYQFDLGPTFFLYPQILQEYRRNLDEIERQHVLSPALS